MPCTTEAAARVMRVNGEQAVAAAPARAAGQRAWQVLVGGFARHSRTMILSLDACSGRLTAVSESAAAGTAPTYFAWNSSQSPAADGQGPPQFLFASNHGKGAPGTGITVVRLTSAGEIVPPVPLQDPSSDAARSSHAPVPDPDHAALSPGGRWVITSAYDDASVSVTEVIYGQKPGQAALGNTTALGVDDVGLAPHQVKFDPSGRFVYVPCLGSSWVRMYAWDEGNGSLTPLVPAGAADNRARLPAGAGPRHLAFHPTLPTVAYTVNELASSVARWDFDPETGALSGDFSEEPERIVSMLPPGTPRGCPIRGAQPGCPVQAAAEIAISRDGRFLYASNRGEQGGLSNIAIFAVDQADGSLTPVSWESGNGRIDFPRMFSLTPDDAFVLVANQKSDSVMAFSRDAATGLMSLTDTLSTTGVVAQPSFIQALPQGQEP